MTVKTPRVTYVANPAYTVRVEYDTDPMDPREWDNLGTMVTWHRGYDLGDTSYSGRYDEPTPAEWLEELKREDPHAVILPLFLIDHSGISMSTHSFTWCDPGEWDSGQVGYIYATRATIREAHGVKHVTTAIRRRVTDCLIAEVDEYDKFLTGQVCAYVVENDRGQVVESCCGFYDPDECLAQGIAAAESVRESRDAAILDARDWRTALDVLATS